MLETYRKILDLLTARERRRFYLLLGLVMLMGVAQMVGVASILPFLAVLARPETVTGNSHLAQLNALLGFTEPRSFLMFLGGAVFVILVADLDAQGGHPVRDLPLRHHARLQHQPPAVAPATSPGPTPGS